MLIEREIALIIGTLGLLLIFHFIPIGFLLGHVELLEDAGEEEDDLDESQRGGQPSGGRVHVPAQVVRPQRNESRLDG